MNNGLSLQALAAMGVGVVILSVDRYALPVRFRVRGPAVECRVPTWSGVGDMLTASGEVTLVAVADSEPELSWLFVRGPATVVPEPEWAGLLPPDVGRVDPDDLYQLIRIQPRRIELIDERRGWGCRETADL